MKKSILLSFPLVLLFAFSAFSQNSANLLSKVSNFSGVNKPAEINLTGTIVPNTSSASALSRAPQGTQRYVKVCYLVSQSEILAAGITKGSKFTTLSFDFYKAQDVPTSGDLKIYFQNSTDTVYTKPSRQWTNGTNGIIDQMTLVHDSAVTIPAQLGYWDIPLSKGTSFTYNGGSMYIAFVYTNPSGPLATVANSVWCSYKKLGGAYPIYNVYSTTINPDTLLTLGTMFRPETKVQWNSGHSNDASVKSLFSFGKLPVGMAKGNPISALIRNCGDKTISNVKVTLNISGANTYSESITIPSLMSDSVITVRFTNFNPVVIGSNTVNISVPADDDNTNNSVSSYLETTSGTIAYQDTTGPLAGNSVGDGYGAGLLLARYHINGTTKVNSVTVTISSLAANVGNTIYGSVLDADGTILASSDNYIIKSTDLLKPLELVFKTPPQVSNQDIYIGFAQTLNTTTAYWPLAVQSESPARDSAFYSSSLVGGAYTSYNTLNRFMIVANLAPVTVPVELSTFTATTKNNVVNLQWSTATETNNSGFDIERSIANNVWAKIGFVKGNSTTTQKSNYSFSDDIAKLNAEKISYRLRQIDFDGTSKYYYLPVSVEVSAPATFELCQNYPNPFNPTTSIRYSIPVASKVKIDIYNTLGQLVSNLVSEYKEAGVYSVDFNASSLSSGVYMYKITAGNFTSVKKMNLLK